MAEDVIERLLIVGFLIIVIILIIVSIDFCNINHDEFQLLSLILTLCAANIGIITGYHWGNSRKDKQA